MAGYVYRGTKTISAEALNASREERLMEARRALEEKRRQIQAIDHGTTKGYAQHLRLGSPTCQACRDATAAYRRKYRKKKVTA